MTGAAQPHFHFKLTPIIPQPAAGWGGINKKETQT
jgi:hypothetical protein